LINLHIDQYAFLYKHFQCYIETYSITIYFITFFISPSSPLQTPSKPIAQSPDNQGKQKLVLNIPVKPCHAFAFKVYFYFSSLLSVFAGFFFNHKSNLFLFLNIHSQKLIQSFKNNLKAFVCLFPQFSKFLL